MHRQRPRGVDAGTALGRARGGRAQAADGLTVTEQAPLFGDLIDAVKWYADREEGAAGEPPDFAPGTNARRRTALKKPPARPSRLLSAMSFRSTRSLGQPSPHSAASSRKSYRG